MLEENKHIYEEKADSWIPNWRDINKNDLVRLASNCDNNNLKDAYISAIMLKYWNKMENYYYKCKLVTTPEDIHTWLVLAVMYAIDSKPWENPNSSIYKDNNGPDKVINRIIESKRLTFYQQLNRYKRKINSSTLSLDSLVDDYKDIFAPSYEDSVDIEYDNLVIHYFQRKDYFMSFLIDAIMYTDVMDSKGLSRRKLSSHLKNLNENYCEIFSTRYSLPLNSVKESVQYVNKLSGYNLKNKIEYNLIKLRNEIKEGA